MLWPLKKGSVGLHRYMLSGDAVLNRAHGCVYAPLSPWQQRPQPLFRLLYLHPALTTAPLQVLEVAQEVAVVLLEEAPEEMEEEIKELHRVVPVVSKINYLKV